MNPIQYLANQGFMPDKELQRFILQSVLKPFLEVKASQGFRLSVTIVFVEGKTLHGKANGILKVKPSMPGLPWSVFAKDLYLR